MNEVDKIIERFLAGEITRAEAVEALEDVGMNADEIIYNLNSVGAVGKGI